MMGLSHRRRPQKAHQSAVLLCVASCKKIKAEARLHLYGYLDNACQAHASPEIRWKIVVQGSQHYAYKELNANQRVTTLEMRNALMVSTPFSLGSWRSSQCRCCNTKKTQFTAPVNGP